jgi:hypothetical protein
MKAERPTNGHEGDGFSSNGSREKQQVDLLHFSHQMPFGMFSLKLSS